MYIINIIILQHISRLRESYIIYLAMRGRGNMRKPDYQFYEIMANWNQAFRVTDSAAQSWRFRWALLTRARSFARTRVCHTPGSISGWYHARHIETKLWTRMDWRIRILRYNGLIMKPSNICRSRRTCNFDRDRYNIQNFLKIQIEAFRH